MALGQAVHLDAYWSYWLYWLVRGFNLLDLPVSLSFQSGMPLCHRAGDRLTGVVYERADFVLAFVRLVYLVWFWHWFTPFYSCPKTIPTLIRRVRVGPLVLMGNALSMPPCVSSDALAPLLDLRVRGAYDLHRGP